MGGALRELSGEFVAAGDYPGYCQIVRSKGLVVESAR